MCLNCPMVHGPFEDLEARLNEVRVQALAAQVKVLTEENYRLQRQHQLLSTFNYIPLLERGDDPVDVIERAIDYSRKALGIERPPEPEKSYWDQVIEATRPKVEKLSQAQAACERATNCCGGCHSQENKR